MEVFFTYTYIYVFKARPEMDDFEGEKNFCYKRKYLFKYFYIVLTDTLAKTSLNIFAYSFISEHSSIFFLF